MPLTLSIISGGQTGADRAALDFAIRHQLRHGGWCPKAREAEDGVLDAIYLLKEAPTDDALERTGWNVRDSDATVVLTLAPKAAGGSQKTVSIAKKQKKPVLHLHRGLFSVHEKIIAFVEKHHVRRIHVAGSRESEEPGIYDWVTSVLEKLKAEFDRRDR